MLQRIRQMFSGRKESATGRAVYLNAKQAQWSKRNYKAFAEEGYQRNVVAYQAINKTADAVATIPIRLFRREQQITEHPLLTLMARPNPMQSGCEWMRATVGFYRIAGNGYLERVMLGNDVRELYTLRPDRMRIIPSETGLPSGYEYKAGSHAVRFPADPMTGESDIRHLKAFNPLDDWYGMSPIEAGAYAVDQHNESMQWMQSLLQNGAAPSGALEVEGDYPLGDDHYNRLKAEIDEVYVGSKNAGRPMILEGGMKWTQMGLSPQQMTIIEQKYSAARDVSLALGVPPLLLNIPGDSTYNNYAEARLAFYEETVLPLADYILDELNNWLAPVYGDGLHLELHKDAIPAIAEKRREMWLMADRSQDLSINERRELKGYEPISGGDSVMMPANLIPLDMASTLAATGQPQEQDGALSVDELKRIAYGHKDAP